MGLWDKQYVTYLLEQSQSKLTSLSRCSVVSTILLLIVLGPLFASCLMTYGFILLMVVIFYMGGMVYVCLELYGLQS